MLHPALRDHFRASEVAEARGPEAALFRRRFGHEIPDYPRHFTLLYKASGSASDEGQCVAYVHQTPHEDMHLCGGLCVDEPMYRKLPRPLFDQVRDEGGFGTVLMRESIIALGSGVAVFAHVGEPRSRQAVLRAGFVDTGRPHLMVVWRKEVSAMERQQRVGRIESLGPF